METSSSPELSNLRQAAIAFALLCCAVVAVTIAAPVLAADSTTIAIASK